MLFIFFFFVLGTLSEKIKERERLILAHNVNSFSSWDLVLLFLGLGEDRAYMAGNFSLNSARKQREKKSKGLRTRYILQGCAPQCLMLRNKTPPFSFFFFFSSCHFLIAHFDMNSSANLTIDSLTTPGHCCIGPNLQTSGWGRFPP